MVTPREYAILSNLIYDEPPYNNLPNDWKLVGYYSDDGYAGGAFRKNNDVVIAHQGTQITQLNDLISDYELLSGKIPEEFLSAKNFVTNITASLNPNDIWSCTGHSLGASIATMIAAFFGKEATVFENPGAKKSLADQGIIPKEGFSVITYNAAPNAINTVQDPLSTTIYRLYPDLQSIGLRLPDILSYISYTLEQHSMDKLLEQFDSNTGLAMVSTDVTALWPTYANHFHGAKGFKGYYDNYDLNTFYFEGMFRNPAYLLHLPFPEPTKNYDHPGLDIISNGNKALYGTNYADHLFGNQGNNDYYPYGGNNIIKDGGRHDTYHITTYNMGGKTIIEDADGKGSFFIDNYNCVMNNSNIHPIHNNPNVKIFFPYMQPECSYWTAPYPNYWHQTNKDWFAIMKTGDDLLIDNLNKKGSIIIKNFHDDDLGISMKPSDASANKKIVMGLDSDFRCHTDYESYLLGPPETSIFYIISPNQYHCYIVSHNPAKTTWKFLSDYNQSTITSLKSLPLIFKEVKTEVEIIGIKPGDILDFSNISNNTALSVNQNGNHTMLDFGKIHLTMNHINESDLTFVFSDHHTTNSESDWLFWTGVSIASAITTILIKQIFATLSGELYPSSLTAPLLDSH